MATSGTISKKIGTNSVYTFWLDWKVNSQNTSANTSNVTVTLKAKRNDGYPSYGAYNNYGNNTIKLTVGGSVKVNNTAANIDLRGDGQTLTTWTGSVSHNTDGTLSLALEGYFYFNSSAASSLPLGGYTVSGTAAIDTIPRKSTVTCTDANVGSAAVITINRASSSFKHTLTHTFGSLSGTIVTKTSDASVGWTLPTTFYAQMTSAKTKSGTITCETFDSSGTSLGTSTCTFTATAISTVSVSGTVVDTNDTTVALTGDSSKLIKYFSTAKATITASTTNSASISTKTINGTSVTSDRTFANCETASFVFAAKDSRGYSASKTVTPTMIQYVKLTANVTIARTTSTGNEITLTVKGNYFNGSFGAKDNTLSVTYRYRESGTENSWSEDILEPVINSNSYTATVTLSGFDYRAEYEFEINAADLLSGDIVKTPVLRGEPVFDWGKSDFNFNVLVKMVKDLQMSGVITAKNGAWIFEGGGVGMDMQNSDIKGLNCMLFNDPCAKGEGLFFPKTDCGGSTTQSDYDELRALDNTLYFNQKVIPTQDKGTWTPVFINASCTYTTQTGYWARMGCLVWLYGSITISAYTSMPNALGIGGFPYAALSGVDTIVTCGVRPTTVTQYVGTQRGNGKSMFYPCKIESSGSMTYIWPAECTLPLTVEFSCVYRTT